ncbi:CBS domain-containing protein [Petrachloros mirabilis]
MTVRTGGMVRDYMHRYLEVVPPDSTVVTVAERMSLRRIGCVLVEPPDSTRGFAGIVTETDLVKKVLAGGLDPSRTTTDRIMASPIVTITGERSMLDASHLMENNYIRHLCVKEADDIVGLVSVRDLVRFFVDVESGPVSDLDTVYRPLSVLMAKDLATIRSEESVLAAALQMREKRIGSLLTVEAGEIVGIVTESDLVRKGLAADIDTRATRVSSVMSHPLIAIDINRTIRDASRQMAEARVRHLAVQDNGKIVGLLSIRDLVKMVSVRDRPRFLGRA